MYKSEASTGVQRIVVVIGGSIRDGYHHKCRKVYSECKMGN